MNEGNKKEPEMTSRQTEKLIAAIKVAATLTVAANVLWMVLIVVRACS